LWWCLQSFFHHAFANGSHLRTAIGVDDGSNNVTSKCRANWYKDFDISFSVFGSVCGPISGGAIGVKRYA
jgi:hypothetical protein